MKNEIAGAIGGWLRHRNILMAAIGTLIAAIFIWFASPGLGYYLTDDDVMNLRKAWPEPVSHLARDCVTFSPAAYRPFGLLVYRAMFTLAGFRPLPFHLLCFALLSLNIFLLGWLARLLTGSVRIGFLAALIGCFHSRMDALYSTTGTVYDLVCFTFYVGGLVWYIHIRQCGKMPRVWQITALLLMYLSALNSKEMAATWPVMLLVYELVYYGMAALRRSWAIGAAAILTALFLGAKLSSASVLVQGYQPRYSIERLLDNWQSYSCALFYGEGRFSAGTVILLWLAPPVIAVVLRSKPLQFSALFLLLTPLPVSFIETRGLYVWYIPLAGWAVYVATLLAIAGRRVRGISADMVQAVIFVTCAVSLIYLHARDWPQRFPWNAGKNVQIRDFIGQVHALRPRIPAGAHILLIDDPFEANDWTPSSLIQLYYHDATLEIERTRQTGRRDSSPATKPDIVFAYRNGRIIEVPRGL